jgi:hypothetical protein
MTSQELYESARVEYNRNNRNRLAWSKDLQEQAARQSLSERFKLGISIEVGLGATKCYLTDSHAYTVISVSKSGKTIQIQRDQALRTDNNGMSESQHYTYDRNPQGEIETARLTKKGWSVKGTRVSLGYRSEYYDYSF